MSFSGVIVLWEKMKGIWGILTSIFKSIKSIKRIKFWIDKIQQQKERKKKSKDYILTTTEGGATVYEYMGSPHHYACPSCWPKIVPLQDARDLTGEFVCPACNAHYPINHRESRTGIVAGEDDDRTFDEV